MNIPSLEPTQAPMTHRSTLISLLAVYMLVSSTSASATNGYFTHGIGPASKAMAGAGDARPSMAIDVANNPASGALLENSTDVGLGFFAPYREYSVSDSMANGQGGAFTLQRSPETVAGTVKSERNLFPIPHFAKNWGLSSDSAVTLAFYGRGGMNTTYRTGAATFDPDGPGPAPVMTLEGTFGAGNAGVNLSQAFLELAYSTQVGDLTLGIAPVLAYQMFEAEVSPALVNGDITIESGDILSEIQESFGMTPEDAEKAFLDIILRRAKAAMSRVKAELLRGREENCAEIVERLVRYAQFVNGELELQVEEGTAWKIFNLYESMDFDGADKDAVEANKDMLKIALGL